MENLSTSNMCSILHEKLRYVKRLKMSAQVRIFAKKSKASCTAGACVFPPYHPRLSEVFQALPPRGNGPLPQFVQIRHQLCMAFLMTMIFDLTAKADPLESRSPCSFNEQREGTILLRRKDIALNLFCFLPMGFG